eukprot:TRINITY_DN27590_c0_g1_i1.p1 TRINITY_DN27590_c0_g1~~TRINITY_DN27590_c0_g1_i1.p1  ORF type:complete len:427 (+),score=48.02 TRINITY_DN27590_c0_g1_i1:89-1369(+)
MTLAWASGGSRDLLDVTVVCAWDTQRRYRVALRGAVERADGAALKARLEQVAGMPVEEQVLRFRGGLVGDRQSLAGAGVRSGAHLVLARQAPPPPQESSPLQPRNALPVRGPPPQPWSPPGHVLPQMPRTTAGRVSSPQRGGCQSPASTQRGATASPSWTGGCSSATRRPVGPAVPRTVVDLPADRWGVAGRPEGAHLVGGGGSHAGAYLDPALLPPALVASLGGTVSPPHLQRPHEPVVRGVGVGVGVTPPHLGTELEGRHVPHSTVPLGPFYEPARCGGASPARPPQAAVLSPPSNGPALSCPSRPNSLPPTHSGYHAAISGEVIDSPFAGDRLLGCLTSRPPSVASWQPRGSPHPSPRAAAQQYPFSIGMGGFASDAGSGAPPRGTVFYGDDYSSAGHTPTPFGSPRHVADGPSRAVSPLRAR